MTHFKVRLVNTPLDPDGFTWRAMAYNEEILRASGEGQFLPGADFTGRGTNKPDAINHLRQQMKLWQNRSEDEWLSLLYSEDGEPTGLAA